MLIRVIRDYNTGNYISSYVEEYPYTGWVYTTHNLSEAMRINSTQMAIEMKKFLRGIRGDWHFDYKEYSNFE